MAMQVFACDECRFQIFDTGDDFDGFAERIDEHEELHRRQLAEITTADAQHALFFVAGDYQLGLQSGSFTTNLMRAIMHADPLNRALVAQPFPSLVRAVTMAAGTVETLEALRTLVKDRIATVAS